MQERPIWDLGRVTPGAGNDGANRYHLRGIMKDYEWTGNPWYDLEGTYYANAEDAERQRNRQRERNERDAIRLAQAGAR